MPIWEYLGQCEIRGEKFQAGFFVDPRRVSHERALKSLASSADRAAKTRGAVATNLRFRRRQGCMSKIGFIPYGGDGEWKPLELPA